MWFIIIAIVGNVVLYFATQKSTKIEKPNNYKKIQEREKNRIYFENNKVNILNEAKNKIEKKQFDFAVDILRKYEFLRAQEVQALLKEIEILKLEDKLKSVPIYEYNKNLELYRELYNLAPSNKTYVDKITFYTNKLNELNKKKALEEKRRESQAISKMFKKHDEMKNITWYRDKSSPKYRNANGFYLYFAPNNLRLVIQYYAKNWLFIKSFSIKADDEVFNIIPKKYGQIERDNGNSGYIWEWIDKNVELSDYIMLEKIANSKTTKIRFNGNQYYSERIISKKEKDALKNVLLAYKILSK